MGKETGRGREKQGLVEEVGGVGPERSKAGLGERNVPQILMRVGY